MYSRIRPANHHRKIVIESEYLTAELQQILFSVYIFKVYFFILHI